MDVCASKYAPTMSACVRESSKEATDPSSHKANHCCDPPKKTVPCLMLTTDSAAAPTVQLGR